ncbi:uncharacterized protein PV07_09514 [Cladophialophora immunda]|uniref:Uncharacterized protein n=1 Tax=Cladophialophora immunda TaxID=569365 RepID=A0A0D2C5I5_9EURO|nr:uncharacterized protein PV07_09514 [Cladophialophora immunda]KIW26418.1 hypothetical protein PV07_09514 [Cladophialophora immunda]
MASSAGLTPLPTSVHHSTTRLTHSQAHSFLSAFLDRAENDAAYRPDSTLTERGPQALSSGSTPNLTLSHLKRILSGMEGKRIGGSLGLEKEAKGKGEHPADEQLEGSGDSDEGQTPRKRGSQKRALNEDEAEDENPETPKSKKQKRKIIYSVNQEGVEDPQVGADVEADTLGQDRVEDDWQDAETYALAQTELLDDDQPTAAEDQSELEGGGEVEGDEHEFEEQDATELDGSSEPENQSHTAIRKRKQRGGDEDADGEGREQKTKKKKATDTVMAERTRVKGKQEMSKEDRKKMKKMRRKDEKKERQREREERNKNR